MLISIITPTRDRPALLAETIASVERQRFPVGWKLEQVICDDGSGPESAEAIGRLLTGRAFVRLVRHGCPLGVSAARNSALAAAQGEMIIDLDDDDLLPPDSLLRRVSHLLGSEEHWSFGNLIKTTAGLRIQPGSELIAEEPRSDWLRAFWSGEAHAWAGTRTYRREALELAGGWDPHLRVAEDLDHWLRLTYYAGPPALCPAYLVYWRSKRRSLGINAVRDGSMAAAVERIRHAWLPVLEGHMAPEPIIFR
jgi:glycosyltransferase involved in cell wall biosynthesis